MLDHRCGPDCSHGNDAQISEEFKVARRSFLRDAMRVGGTAVSASALTVSMTPAALAQSAKPGSGMASHYYIPASANTVLWGYFSRSAKPVVEVESGDFVTMETLTHHANDDAERMVRGDPGAESVFYWDKQRKGVDRRGAGPLDAKNGTGGGQGVHICTGPVAVKGAEPGDKVARRIRGLGAGAHRRKVAATLARGDLLALDRDDAVEDVRCAHQLQPFAWPAAKAMNWSSLARAEPSATAARARRTPASSEGETLAA